MKFDLLTFSINQKFKDVISFFFFIFLIILFFAKKIIEKYCLFYFFKNGKREKKYEYFSAIIDKKIEDINS